MTELQLGKLVGVYGLSPVFKQRAFVVAAVSFIFFTTMVFGFLVRPGFVFVLLGTAFLVVGLFTLFGWLAQKNAQFKLYENGFSYRKFVCLWNEIESANVETENSRIGVVKKSCLVRRNDGQEVLLTDSLADFENIVRIINSKSLKNFETAKN